MLGAVDIGGTKIAVAAVRESGVIAARRACLTAAALEPEAAVREIAAMLHACTLESAGAVTAVGVGCTGPVDPEEGVIGNVDLLPGWSGFPLVARLRQEFGVEVAMENDADAAALAEAAWGAGREASRFLYVTVGTGIGAALVTDGRLYRGAGGWHPEAGHHTIDPAGPECYCGARGCWESLAAGPAMSAWAHAHAGAEDPLPEAAGAAEVCALAASGHRAAVQAVEREARYLGIGLANLITIFCPDRIALGGGVMESAALLLPGIRAAAEGRCGLVPFDPAAITGAALGSDAALLGAARVPRYRRAESAKANPCV